MSEIQRQPVKSFPVKLTCRACGKNIDLWFNGGELDQQECCGYIYGVEATGYEMYVEQPRAARPQGDREEPR